MMTGIRIILCLAMITGGTAAGFYFSHRLTNRKEQLNELIQGLEYLKNEIYYTRAPLQYAAMRASEISSGKAQLFLWKFSKLLSKQNEDVQTLWYLCAAEVLGGRNVLTEKDIRCICALGAELGKTDVSGQCKSIGRTMLELSKHKEDAQQAEQQKGHVYRTAGVAAGLLCAVLAV